MRVALLLALSAATAAAQVPQVPDSAVFTRTDTMIAMRDGVRLHTTLYVPKGATEPLPILFERTPYGIDRYYRPTYTSFGANRGYIFAFQDLHGRSGSEGEFVLPIVTSASP